MPDEHKRAVEAPNEIVQQVVGADYAKFCAQHGIRPSAMVARRFALEVTESGAKAFHGLDSAALEKHLIERFDGEADGAQR